MGTLPYKQSVVDWNLIMHHMTVCVLWKTLDSQEKEVQTSIFSPINGVVPDDQSPPALIFNVYVYVWSQVFIFLIIMTANHGILEFFNWKKWSNSHSLNKMENLATKMWYELPKFK